ncbi:right-handed parallel beta-helix repeat-containing protein, partial [Candidatus Bipolaricaulota bacterium]|nr:right-handed parallel beta-helix repeat-containing protein [Candidatus Bipolaricaulota bacterium]
MKFSIEKRFSFSLLFIYLLTLVFFVTASAGRLVVSPEGGKFESVEKAVSVAEPGDTVFIESGTFKGGLKIEKDLTLKGAGKQKVRIQGSEKGKPVLLVGPSAASVTVKNLTLQDASGELCEDLNRGLCPSGVSLVGKAQVKLRDVIIKSNKKDGLSLIDSSSISVKDAEIKGNGRYGVRLSDSSRLEIKNGKIRNNWIDVALYK